MRKRSFQDIPRSKRMRTGRHYGRLFVKGATESISLTELLLYFGETAFHTIRKGDHTHSSQKPSNPDAKLYQKTQGSEAIHVYLSKTLRQQKYFSFPMKVLLRGPEAALCILCGTRPPHAPTPFVTSDRKTTLNLYPEASVHDSIEGLVRQVLD